MAYEVWAGNEGKRASYNPRNEYLLYKVVEYMFQSRPQAGPYYCHYSEYVIVRIPASSICQEISRVVFLVCWNPTYSCCKTGKGILTGPKALGINQGHVPQAWTVSNWKAVNWLGNGPLKHSKGNGKLWWEVWLRP